MRAAASSIASGRPSRPMQISATAGALAAVSANSGSTAWARATNSATAGLAASDSRAPSAFGSGSSNGGIGTSCSPPIRSGLRLDTSTFSRLAIPRIAATAGAASVTCSKLSSTSSRCLSRRWSPRASTTDSPGTVGTSRTSAIASGTSSASDTAASSTKYTPPEKRSLIRDASSIDSRVLPVPPGPVRVTTRTSGSNRTTGISSSWRSRPISGEEGMGSFCGATSYVDSVAISRRARCTRDQLPPN